MPAAYLNARPAEPQGASRVTRLPASGWSGDRRGGHHCQSLSRPALGVPRVRVVAPGRRTRRFLGKGRCRQIGAEQSEPAVKLEVRGAAPLTQDSLILPSANDDAQGWRSLSRGNRGLCFPGLHFDQQLGAARTRGDVAYFRSAGCSAKGAPAAFDSREEGDVHGDAIVMPNVRATVAAAGQLAGGVGPQ